MKAVIGKVALGMTGGEIVAQIANGPLTAFGAATYHETVAGYLDPSSVDGYTYNPTDESWYAFPPSAISESWRERATLEQKAGFDLTRHFRMEHNRREETGPEKTANDRMNKEFEKGLGFVPQKDPLALDLDGDGIETLSTTSGVKFDFEGLGIKVTTGWVSPDDGILALDINNNGIIDNGSELFGVYTRLQDGSLAKDGFDALSSVDSNRDAIFDAQDLDFSKALVWRDLNSDGISQSNEMSSLLESGVLAVNLKSSISSEDSNGNLISATGSFVRTDQTTSSVGGKLSLAVNLDLAQDSHRTEFADSVPVDGGLIKLPNIDGSGRVRDLHESASLSSTLKELLVRTSSETDGAKQKQLTDELIYEWARTSDSKTIQETLQSLSSETQKISFNYSWVRDDRPPTENELKLAAYIEQLYVLEAFNNFKALNFTLSERPDKSLVLTTTTGMLSSTTVVTSTEGIISVDEKIFNFDAQQKALFTSAYTELFQSTFSQIALQTRLLQYVEQVDLNVVNGVLQKDYTDVVKLLEANYANSKSEAISDLLDIATIFGGGASSWVKLISSWSISANTPGYRTTLGTNNEDTFFLDSAGGVAEGLGGFDRIEGSSGQDIILGGGDNDYINGRDGNDIIDGGTGDDRLVGGLGSDTFTFSIGDGKDIIAAESRNETDVETVAFGEGIERDTLFFSRSTSDLIVGFGQDDQLTISGFFESYNIYSKVQSFYFNNGDILSADEVKLSLLLPGENRPVIIGYASDDSINGGDGDQRISGAAGNDVLLGGAGKDVLNGDEGNDILDGGTGNDILAGGSGSDVYNFGVGYGQDVTYDGRRELESKDILLIKGSLTLEDIYFSRTDLDLTVGLKDKPDTFTLYNFYDRAGLVNGYLIGEIRFESGGKLDLEQINSLVNTPTEASNMLHGDQSNNEINGLGGNDYIYSHAGNDILDGGLGEDTLEGGDGNDILIGGGGRNILSGGNGSDTYIYRGNSGQDFIRNLDISEARQDGLILENLLPDQVRLVRWGDDLVITPYDTNNYLVNIQQFFNGGYSKTHKIDQITFADGTKYDIARMMTEVNKGTSLSDTLVGTPDDEELFGLGGNDDIFAGSGNDFLYGGEGRDRLFGEAGDDTFNGGSGNDLMYGGEGFDTFILSRGGGIDSAPERDAPMRIQVSAGISPSEVLVSLQSGLVVTIAGTEDKIRSFWESDNPKDLMGATEVIFADGTRWGREELIERAAMASEFDDYLIGTDIGGTINGLGGDDFIVGGNGGDNLTGGFGDDSLLGEAGDDTLNGGSGNDYLKGGAGNDYLDGGEGDDGYFDVEGKNTYVFGEGHDSIGERSDSTHIELRHYSFSELSFAREGMNLAIKSFDKTTSMNIQNYFNPSQTPDSTDLTFIDSSETFSYSFENISRLVEGAKVGTEHQDNLYGGLYADKMYGLGGDDSLYGYEGRDHLNGGLGNDILTGGKGDDEIIGGAGENTIVYQRNDGADTVYQDADSNILLLGKDIKLDSLDFYRTDDNLIVRFDEKSDQQVKVIDFFGNPSNSFKGVVLGDGTVLTEQWLTGSAVPEISASKDFLPENIFTGTDGDDLLTGGANDDFLFGGAGNDFLAGGLGSDLYQINADVGHTIIHDTGGMNDVLLFNNLSIGVLTNYYKTNQDFILELNQGATKVEIKDFFAYNGSEIESFSFAEGQLPGSTFLDPAMLW
ncbi:calcium-binding protein [Pseudomonas syringae]|uniref:calcium-binding protein n=1 Tax=Pseudomonas syringae TaxID=317 RepID=UPI0018E5B952|nr:calcium-binding protein [Pseudomonas syringae]MBI6562434.1 hypothetical protein [Pseudomonas syringae]MBI6572528.1 hypothetical protein [Pseudomonas syringae]MBI6589787.1 hypothetical protein [Pseudomonas syringae]MBI6594936.1 hypothetical protein [Pseudomonas syringae]MDC6528389.1 calcium-binding protein [Pseudomonas syringae]